MPGGSVGRGVPAQLLPEICDVWLKANDSNKLLDSQKPIAARAYDPKSPVPLTSTQSPEDRGLTGRCAATDAVRVEERREHERQTRQQRTSGVAALKPGTTIELVAVTRLSGPWPE
jgi:hypothetical protein